jgi:glutamate synthase (ferredoxin)
MENLYMTPPERGGYPMPEHDACGIGTVVNIDGHADYRTLDDALHIVEKLEHRAGKDATGKVGDGVGILLQVSHTFLKKATKEAGISVGEAERLRRRHVFLPAG